MVMNDSSVFRRPGSPSRFLRAVLRLGRPEGGPPLGFHKNVIITAVESDVIPGRILWRQWKINPFWIRPNTTGRLAVYGQSHMMIRQKIARGAGLEYFEDLETGIVEEARKSNQWIVAVAHPNVPGLIFERVVACSSSEVRLFHRPMFAPTILPDCQATSLSPVLTEAKA